MTTSPSIQKCRFLSLPQAVALSFISTLLAAFMASCASVIFDFLENRYSGASLLMMPVALFIVFTAGSIMAMPFGLVIGTPIVWGAQVPIARHPIISTIALSLLGCALGYPIEQYLNANSIQRGADLPSYMGWGAIVGGMHGLAVCQTLRRSTATVARTAVVAMLVVPAISVSVTHLLQNAYARRGSCDYTVSELDQDLAIRADKALALSPGNTDRVTASIGDWVRSDDAPSRAHSYSAILVNGQKAIAINDEAVLPQSLLTDFGFPSSVEQRCTDMYTGPHAKLVRHFSRPVRLARTRH